MEDALSSVSAGPHPSGAPYVWGECRPRAHLQCWGAGEGEPRSGVPPGFSGTGSGVPWAEGSQSLGEGRGGAGGAGYAQDGTSWLCPRLDYTPGQVSGFRLSAGLPWDRVDQTVPPGAVLGPWLGLCGSSRTCPAPRVTPLVHGWELLLCLPALAGALSSLLLLRASTRGAVDRLNPFNKEMGVVQWPSHVGRGKMSGLKAVAVLCWL